MPDTTQSWMWWMFSTVILAVLLNLTSSYVKPYIDNGLDRFSKRRKLKSRKKQEEYERKLSRLLGNRNRFISLQTKIILATFGLLFVVLLNISLALAKYYAEEDPLAVMVGELGYKVFIGVSFFVSWVIFLYMLNRFKEFVNLSRDFMNITDPNSEDDNETNPDNNS